VHVTLPDGAGLESLRAAFDPGEEVRVAGPEDAVSPAESAGKAGVLVAGLRQAGDRSGFWLWALTDDLKSGAARNAVRIAETILERGMPRSAA
jgi:aspartate-semialdehyde dehydrogenase